MYLTRGHGYYTPDGQQRTSRGLFLLLVQPNDWEEGNPAFLPIKVCVRTVALQQCGHWMMGTARLYGHSYTMSGAYGGDGLTMSVPRAVYDRLLVMLPTELHEAWNKGGGWNSAGSEAGAMRRWALAHLEELRK